MKIPYSCLYSLIKVLLATKMHTVLNINYICFTVVYPKQLGVVNGVLHQHSYLNQIKANVLKHLGGGL